MHNQQFELVRNQYQFHNFTRVKGLVTLEAVRRIFQEIGQSIFRPDVRGGIWELSEADLSVIDVSVFKKVALMNDERKKPQNYNLALVTN